MTVRGSYRLDRYEFRALRQGLVWPCAEMRFEELGLLLLDILGPIKTSVAPTSPKEANILGRNISRVCSIRGFRKKYVWLFMGQC